MDSARHRDSRPQAEGSALRDEQGRGTPPGSGEGGCGPWSQWEEPGRLEGGERDGAASQRCLGPTQGAAAVGSKGNPISVAWQAPPALAKEAGVMARGSALTGRAWSSRNMTPREGAGGEPQPDTRPLLADRGPAPPDFLSRWQPPQKGACSEFSRLPQPQLRGPLRGEALPTWRGGVQRLRRPEARVCRCRLPTWNRLGL